MCVHTHFGIGAAICVCVRRITFTGDSENKKKDNETKGAAYS